MTDYVFIAAALALGGFSKGVIGLGLPTIAVGLLGLIMAPVQAAALLLLPNLVTNAWQAWNGPALGALLRRLRPLLAGIALGTAGATGLLSTRPSPEATALLGAALALYAGLGLAAVQPRLPARAEAAAGLLAGALTGLLTALTGVFVIPAVPYLQALGLAKEEMVQALGLSFLVSTVTLGTGLLAAGLVDGAVALASLAALLPVAAGMAAGAALRASLSQRVFRLCFLASLLALGGYLMARSL